MRSKASNGTITVFTQVVSPARGQSLLPQLEDITVVNLGGGASAEVYLDPGQVGANQLHVIVDGGAGPVSAAVTASLDGGPPAVLRQLQVGPGHFVAYAYLAPGAWEFRITATVGGRPEPFVVRRTVG